MKHPIFAVALLIMLSACGSEKPAVKSDTVQVTDAVIRLAAVEGRPGAGYFTLHGGKIGDRLTAISSSKAATIELHEDKMQAGMMSMQPLTGIDVPADGEVAFKPGGNHVMLFGMDPAVKAGDMVPLHFIFQSGASADAKATAIAPGEDMPEREEQ